jgi:hypothetical protein
MSQTDYVIHLLREAYRELLTARTVVITIEQQEMGFLGRIKSREQSRVKD